MEQLDPLECVAFLIIRDGQVLGERRSPAKRVMPGALAIPGGHVEPGESLLDTVKRELREELEVAPRIVRYVCTLLHRSAEFRKLHYYAVEAWDGDPIAYEAEALHWVALDDLRPLDLDVDRLAVSEYLRLYRAETSDA